VYRNSDELLYVISANKEMSWLSFKQAFNYLHSLSKTAISDEGDDMKNKILSTVRALNSLGHCEFDFTDNNRRRVYVAPPVLIRLPSGGFPQAILAGVRTPNTIDKLRNACQSVGQHINIDVAEQRSELILVPKRIVVQTEDISELHKIAAQLAINFIETPSSWSLLHFAASLEDSLINYQWSNEPELNWKSKTFDENILRFILSPTSIEDDSGKRKPDIRLSQYQHPYRNTKIYYLWQEERCTQVERDWGRYAVLKSAKIQVLIYDQRRFIMAVPVGAKLPQLLERALTLCSGYAPIFIEKLPLQQRTINSFLSKEKEVVTNLNVTGFNLFRDVPPQIAEMTAAKLDQTMLIKSLDINFEVNDD
jgi:hypothetical protein